MTPSLRRAHRRIWLALAIVLPVVFIAAVASIPETQIAITQADDQPEALPQIRFTAETDHFILTVRADDMTAEQQLEIRVKEPLEIPGCLVYLKCGDTEKLLIGKLGSKHAYRFSMETIPVSGACNIEFLNPFKNSVFESVGLE